eukprot:GDKK01058927.1.p1 GENE.GDKK01058927.1~~GDKK01058927.1.p1  ORF type:complete len:281 (+),score=31.45 GDKK01058927.1:20-862(+)
MGAKESKPVQTTHTHGGFITDAVPPNANLINDRRAHQRPAQQAQSAVAANQQQAAKAQEPTVQRLLPVVIRYRGPDVKARIAEGQNLFVITGNNSRFPMSKSENDYFAIVDLPPGDNAYKFTVDGNSAFSDPSQPSVQRDSEVVNVVNVHEVLLQTKDDDDTIDDAAGWGQERVVFEETRKYPPMLPPHLRYTPLNAPPTQMRVAPDGSMQPSSPEHLNRLDAEHLPLPLSVTINHVYFQRRDDHTITGITTRYRDKYTTVAYYRGETLPKGSIPILTTA